MEVAAAVSRSHLEGWGEGGGGGGGGGGDNGKKMSVHKWQR